METRHTGYVCHRHFTSVRLVYQSYVVSTQVFLPEHPSGLLVMSLTRRYNVGMTIQNGHVVASHGCKKQLRCLQQRQVCCQYQSCLQPAEPSSRSAGPAAACAQLQTSMHFTTCALIRSCMIKQIHIASDIPNLRETLTRLAFEKHTSLGHQAPAQDMFQTYMSGTVIIYCM